MNRYPDTNSTTLLQALAAKYGVADEQLAVGCGSVVAVPAAGAGHGR